MMDTPTYVHTVAAQAYRYLLAFWNLSGSANSEIVRLAYKTEHAYPILYEIWVNGSTSGNILATSIAYALFEDDRGIKD